MKPRGDRWIVGIVLGMALVGALIVVTQPRPARLIADFTIDYSAGVLVREGNLAAPYEQHAMAVTIHRVAPESTIDTRLPFNKPLAAAIPYALLSLLPIDVAFRVWQAIAVLLLMSSLAFLHQAYPLHRKMLRWAGLGTVSAVPVWAALTEGQPTPLVLLGAVVLLRTATWRRSDRWQPASLAAAGGALMAVKPQYLPAYLLVLLAARRPLAFLAATLAGAAVLMSPLIGGAPTLLAMIHNALLANQVVSIRADESWVGVLAAILPASLASLLGLVLYAAALLGLAWLAWRRSLEVTLFVALAGMLAVLTSPHALPHDLVILAIPVWLSFALWREGRLSNPLIPWLLVDLALVVDLRGIGLPVAAVALTAALAWAWFDIRQRLARAAAHPVLPMAG